MEEEKNIIKILENYGIEEPNLTHITQELLVLFSVSNCGKLQSEVESRRKQITDINQWTEILLAYRHKIRERPLWSIIADINNRTTD
ncbi:MAG: hypothetical protein GY755_10180 [Chloroflexi bacterium]|nr:hypothetical protein [Chloroflexota bacterium]